jgi:hypothetical protein
LFCRQKVLQGLLKFVSHATEKTPEKKTIEKSAQTDTIPQSDMKSSPTYQQVPVAPTSTPIVTNEKPLQETNETQSTSALTNTEKPIDAQPLSTKPAVSKAVPPPPSPRTANLQTAPSTVPPPPPLPADLQTAPSAVPPPPPLPADLQTAPSGVPPPPPPPLPADMQIGSSGIPPPPPPPPGFPGAPPPVHFGNKPSVAGLSALVDSIPKPKGKVRRLQWKKLPQTILSMLIYSSFFSSYFLLSATSQFWIDVNKKVNKQINFSELEDCFKVKTENNNTTALAAKAKATTVTNKFSI